MKIVVFWLDFVVLHEAMDMVDCIILLLFFNGFATSRMTYIVMHDNKIERANETIVVYYLLHIVCLL